uniref:Uncharacterized protein n=1 Tax=Octopus bimaculoides TaxID=37653 RepID=A0A0L8HYE2_OCTBM
MSCCCDVCFTPIYVVCKEISSQTKTTASYLSLMYICYVSQLVILYNFKVGFQSDKNF